MVLHLLTPESKSPTMDIVAVHGLNGHYRNTWTHTSSATMWLRDLLPEKLPGCRVMSFQYDASINGASVGNIRSAARVLLQELMDKREDPEDPNIYANHPIVFVGHSLGGLVIKQALVLANDRPKGTGDDFSNIAQHAKGMVFFGTPHRGANAAQWALQVTKIAGAVFRRPPSKFLKMLQRDSDDLYDISEDFLPISAKYAIVSFYEEYAQRFLGKVIVDRYSAIMGLSHEQYMMLSGTHTSMCRFSRDDEQFDAVWRRVKRAAAGVPPPRATRLTR